MKKALKIAGIIAAVAVALLLVLIVAVKIVVTPERVKRTVLPLVEKKLHRKVLLQEVDVSIFSGIVLKGLTVKEREEEEVFVKADRVKLRYQFWPLLRKRVVIDEVMLDAPQIRVVRLSDGTFNYSDIMKKEPKAEPKPEEKEPVDLLVSSISLTGGEVRFEDRAVKSGSAAIYNISGIKFSSRNIALDSSFPFTAEATIFGATIEVEGKAANLGAKPSIDATINVKNADLAKIAASLPPNYAAKAKPFAPSGKITARLHLAGILATPKQLLKEGSVKLEQVQVNASGQRPSLSGEIALQGDNLSSKDLTLTSGKNSLLIQMAASGLLGKQLSIKSTVTSENFDLDPFLAKGEKTSGGVRTAAAKPEPGPLKLPVNAAGTFQIGRTKYKGLPLTRLLLKYRLSDNILTIEQLSGNVADGSFAGSARVDLSQKGFAYSSSLKLQEIQANPLVSAFAPKAAGTVYGALSLNAALGGKGTQPNSLKKNLSGNGDFTISNGKLTGAGLVQALATFINVEQLRVLQFTKFAGTYRIANEKVFLDSGISGRDAQITPKGSAGFDKSLDMSLMTRLSPELTGRIAKGGVTRFITDDKGWGTLPLKVTGTFSSPNFRLDSAAVREQFKLKTRETLQKTIEERLKRKEGEPQRPERELLEKGLRGILGN
ncbi:AsmA family protein [Geobacter sp. DSM 9736]|uniref:DUF748 domain-containing protein n=1 Tax=Geobacter sp. DSM 9736 TaxID=1277350 RepID=UPI000B601665|nr:AsmA family protein [Geobacter sp. DSM 9736]SNB45677.1 AsmA protein [Geobacter sp. DSM 9736]